MKIVKETQLDYYKVFGLWLIISLFLMFPPLFCYELFFDFSDYPGHDIPWYYIRRDFVKSFILSFGLIPTIIFGTIFIKTKKSSYFGICSLGLIYYLPSLKRFIIILNNTTNIFSKTEATTTWGSQLDYLASFPLTDNLYIYIPLFVVMFFISRKFSINEEKQNDIEEKITNKVEFE